MALRVQRRTQQEESNAFAVQSNSFDGQSKEIAVQNDGEHVAAQPLPSRARVSRSRRHRSHRCALPLASVAGDEQFQIDIIEMQTDEGGLPTAEGAARSPPFRSPWTP
ncbi:uncharacterized protein SCHCODRAFT_02672416 [Schizophyllum commune H4-8]|nr:uncharacterized protein SCHCODRAFT_02672416 [Schizophyllum commune H4-8]KAI5887286.1 hypothetical protein SCHCODRAFT_02672416 [Schizophyllum commune H4-8]